MCWNKTKRIVDKLLVKAMTKQLHCFMYVMKMGVKMTGETPKVHSDIRQPVGPLFEQQSTYHKHHKH